MKLIIGLGNPGPKYSQTRHNAGFLALDFYLKDKQPISCASKFEAEICELHFGDNKVLFVKPQTFMNDSGKAVQEIAQFYKVNPVDILIIHDDTDLPLGKIKVAPDSSSAGHNGIKDIFERFNTQQLLRIRIGVESRDSRTELPTDVFVLKDFTPEQFKLLDDEVFPQVSLQIEAFINS